MEPKDFVKLIFVLTVLGVVLYLSSSIDFNNRDRIDLPSGMTADTGKISAGDIDIGRDRQDDIPAMPDRPDGQEVHVPIIFDNPIDPTLSDKEVCILYLNNRTNSCGNFSGGSSSYSMSSSASVQDPEDVAIPEFPMLMVPMFACLLGLYMRRSVQDI